MSPKHNTGCGLLLAETKSNPHLSKAINETLWREALQEVVFMSRYASEVMFVSQASVFAITLQESCVNGSVQGCPDLNIQHSPNQWLDDTESFLGSIRSTTGVRVGS